MKPVKLTKITPAQRTQMEELIRTCCLAEPIRLSIPLPAADEPLSGECFFALYDRDRLISLIHLFYPDYSVGELIGFTDPKYRRQGCFTQLLDCAADEADELGLSQVYVISDGRSSDAEQTLFTLGLDAEYTEYMLEKTLTKQTDTGFSARTPLVDAEIFSLKEVSSSEISADIFCRIFNVSPAESSSYLEEISSDARIRTFTFMKNDCVLGQTQITMMDGLAYLSGFGILPDFRRQGLGLTFLHFLEDSLAGEGITKLTLQVSSKNKTALSLYRKDGFDVLESLHYSPLFEEE